MTEIVASEMKDPETLTDEELVELRKQFRAGRSSRQAREFAVQFAPRS